MMPRTISLGLGQLTPAVWRQIAQSVNALDDSVSARSSSTMPKVILARITAAARVTNRARWKYQFEEVTRAADQAALTNGGTTLFPTRSGGITSAATSLTANAALNLLEANNGAATAYGNAVEADGITLVANPLFQVAAVPNGTIVEMTITRDRGGVNFGYFSAPNPIVGSCE